MFLISSPQLRGKGEGCVCVISTMDKGRWAYRSKTSPQLPRREGIFWKWKALPTDHLPALGNREQRRAAKGLWVRGARGPDPPRLTFVGRLCGARCAAAVIVEA